MVTLAVAAAAAVKSATAAALVRRSHSTRAANPATCLTSECASSSSPAWSNTHAGGMRQRSVIRLARSHLVSLARLEATSSRTRRACLLQQPHLALPRRLLSASHELASAFPLARSRSLTFAVRSGVVGGHGLAGGSATAARLALARTSRRSVRLAAGPASARPLPSAQAFRSAFVHLYATFVSQES